MHEEPKMQLTIKHIIECFFVFVRHLFTIGICFNPTCNSLVFRVIIFAKIMIIMVTSVALSVLLCLV